MPSYTRGQTRDNLRFVKANAGNIYHGFKPKDLASIPGVTAADVTALGHKAVAQVPAAGYAVIGANSPKPQRVQKIINKRANANQQRAVSTFCSYDSLIAAQTVGWELIGYGRGARGGITPRGENVGVDVDAEGGIYVFWINGTDVGIYADLLGLKRAATMGATERNFAFSGASRPRPAKMGKLVDEATLAKFSSFVSYDKEDEALEAGFKYIFPAVIGPKPATGGTGGTGGT